MSDFRRFLIRHHKERIVMREAIACIRNIAGGLSSEGGEGIVVVVIDRVMVSASKESESRDMLTSSRLLRR